MMFHRYLHALRTYRWLLQAPWKSSDQIERDRDARLRRLVSIAYRTVPYYRHLFDRIGLRPEEIQGVRDLRKIPVTRREDLQQLTTEEIISSEVPLDQCIGYRTSGSSGVPLTIYRTRDLEDLTRLARFRAWRLNGARFTDRILNIGPGYERFPALLQKCRILRTQKSTPFAQVETQLEMLKTHKPTLLRAYPSCARVLAQAVLEAGLHKLSVKRIFLSSEFLDSHTEEDFCL